MKKLLYFSVWIENFNRLPEVTQCFYCNDFYHESSNSRSKDIFKTSKSSILFYSSPYRSSSSAIPTTQTQIGTSACSSGRCNFYPPKLPHDIKEYATVFKSDGGVKNPYNRLLQCSKPIEKLHLFTGLFCLSTNDVQAHSACQPMTQGSQCRSSCGSKELPKIN
ncbi:hypothetical protein CDAR_470411 [Caerostris darwini]|uniref:Uncharacterized protein n=1 Tax=Caerostris darwini TaxID=1538125 RepID=A0AAV4VGA6_9ARAC|nr:hypothetical protein CDAR_470411 [Caerostris darwini]